MELADGDRGEAVTSRRKSWNCDEEMCIIEEVLAREHALFGEIRGFPGKSIHKQRIDCWQEVANAMNARFLQSREAVEVKKKYFNLKQRAKEKIDSMKKSRTLTGGGPPPPSLTAAEEALTSSLADRPSVSGLSTGIDTDEQNMENSCTLSAPTDVKSSGDPTATTCPTLKRKAVRQDKCGKGNKMSQQHATYENTLEDTKRIKLEQEKLKKEIQCLEVTIKKMETESNLLQSKQLYLTLKIQSEFGVVCEGNVP